MEKNLEFYFVIIGFIALCTWLNIINGNIKNIYNKINENKSLKLSLISLFILFFPLVLYLIWDKSSSTTKSNSENIIPIQIQSALISAFIAYKISAYRSKVEETFNLHRELNTDLYSNRIKAETIIKTDDNRVIPLSELYLRNPEESKDLLLIIRFYERLYFAIHYDQVNAKIIPSLFGNVFFWWYIFCFKEQFKSTSWDSKDNIENLYKWFVQNSSEEEVCRWTKNVEDELNIFLESKKSAPP